MSLDYYDKAPFRFNGTIEQVHMHYLLAIAIVHRERLQNGMSASPNFQLDHQPGTIELNHAFLMVSTLSVIVQSLSFSDIVGGRDAHDGPCSMPNWLR